MELIALECNRQKLDGGAMFGNAPKALWSKWITPDEKNRIELATRCLLVKTDDGKNILFETGVGTFFEPKLKERYGIVENEHMLLKNLERIGLSDRDIDAIILSHLHFDHAGGLLPEYGDDPPRLLFPNARYYIGKRHWEMAQSPHIREKASFIPLLHQLLESSGRVIFVNGDKIEKFGFPINFHFSEGHTVGLMVSIIDLPKGPLVFISDLCPGMPWVHLPITMGYDRYAEHVVDEKNALFEELIDKGAKLFFTHDPSVACGALTRDENGRFSCDPVDLSTVL